MKERLKEISNKISNDLKPDRIFDCRGDLKKHLEQIIIEFKTHGHLHLINTNLDRESLIKIMPEIGFSKEHSFTIGKILIL